MPSPSPVPSPLRITTPLHGEHGEEEVSWATGRSSANRRSSIAHRLQGYKTLTPLTINHSLGDLDADPALPISSPSAQSFVDEGQSRVDLREQLYFPGQAKSLVGIATRAFCLGAALSLGVILTIATLIWTSSPLWRLPFFLASLATFHFLEFWTTAAYNTLEAKVGSFILTSNGSRYLIAHISASIECLLTSLLFPHRSWAPLHSRALLVLLGLALMLVGQVARSVAMVQAGHNFNHTIQRVKKPGHTLVTAGIYGTLRHPSYFGFFWWALGTQLVMGNVVCFFAYFAVLWKFFSDRIQIEEAKLVEFFPEEYEKYRKEVPTRIPFIP